MKLKLTLLLMILENIPNEYKYSKSFLNLKNVLELERDENTQNLEQIEKKFKNIEKKYKYFINGIPLKIVEKYYFSETEELDSYLYLNYDEKDIVKKRSEVFLELEDFFEEVFKIACLIANLYNLEIKINENQNKSSENKFV